MKYFKILFVISILGICFSCERNKDIPKEEALLIWQGDYESDGCGFFIEINGEEYKLANESIIEESYKVIGKTRVEIKYKFLGKIRYCCGDAVIDYCGEGIEVIAIKKK